MSDAETIGAENASTKAAATAAGNPPPAPASVVGRSGAMVEFCLPYGPFTGEWRPALLIKEWQPGYWSAAVFNDGGNDEAPAFPHWIPSCVAGEMPGCWRLSALPAKQSAPSRQPVADS